MSPDQIVLARQQALAVINALPQRALVPDARIQRWLDIMAAREPERLVWHAIRQSGFSGSEVGTLVANRRGARAQFGSARKLVMQKLFMAEPDAPDAHMLRGLETEELHRQKLMKVWNATRDTEAFQALSRGRGRFPFLRYSPDDVFTIQKHRVLLDFKAPSKVEDEEFYAFEYQCQINLGAEILRLVGMPADHGMISRLSWQNWTCSAVWVELDTALQDEIAEAAHHYWTNYVLRGDVPPYVVNEMDADLDQDLRAELVKRSAQIVAIDEVTAGLAERRENLVRAMGQIAAHSGSSGRAHVFSHTVKAIESVNKGHLEDVIAEHGLNVEEEMRNLTVVTRYDADKLVRLAQEAGLDIRSCEVQRAFVVQKVADRLQELNIPLKAVLEYEYDVRKSRRHSDSVQAFKPVFQQMGAELDRYVAEQALLAVGCPPETSQVDPDSEPDEGEVFVM